MNALMALALSLLMAAGQLAGLLDQREAAAAAQREADAMNVPAWEINR